MRGCQRRFILLSDFRLEREWDSKLDRRKDEKRIDEKKKKEKSESRSQELRKECLKRISSKVKKGGKVTMKEAS